EATARIVAGYEARLDKELDVPVATTKTALDALEADVRSRETNLADLITDVMRTHMQADLALLDGGVIRSDRTYPPGPLTRRNIVAILPFEDILCKVQVSGATVLAALNHGVAQLGAG